MEFDPGDASALSPAYGDDQIRSIEADIAAMEDFAAGLAAEVEKNFGPEATRLTAELRASLPGSATFPELEQFLATHQHAKTLTYQNITEFRGDTHRLASAAQKVGQEYRDVDAFSRARVRDVEDALADGATMSTAPSRDDSRELKF